MSRLFVTAKKKPSVLFLLLYGDRATVVMAHRLVRRDNYRLC